MSILVAIDPGLRGCGAALFDNGTLIAAGFPTGEKDTHTKRADTWLPMIRAVSAWVRTALGTRTGIFELVIELPQVYDPDHQTGRKRGTNPEDLIELAAVVGGVTTRLSAFRTHVYLPFEWKRQVPKEIMHERAIERLTREESAAVKLPRQDSLSHNVWDAVSLGLRHLKRM